MLGGEGQRRTSLPPDAKRARRRVRALITAFALALTIRPAPAAPTDLSQTIERVKPSVVAIGTFLKLRNPAIQFYGTGFVVGDGRYVVTNAHVVDRPLDTEKKEARVVMINKGGEPQPRDAELLAMDKAHDLALLRISGEPVAALRLGDSASVKEGRMLAFTGFPIGMVLGFHPATHRGMVSAITPVVLPGITSRDLSAQMIARLRDSAYSVFQLDGTAYPGNSGSALYDPDDGTVVGIINSVLVKGTRENALSQPSGITYAIPVRYIREMLQREKVPGID